MKKYSIKKSQMERKKLEVMYSKRVEIRRKSDFIKITPRESNLDIGL